MTHDKPRRLGRGLEALLASRPPIELPAAQERGALQRIPITSIRANPFQPRKEFRADQLAELETSLKTSGLIQPVTVRPAPNGIGYELVAGERRLRAATNLGWAEIPAIIKELDDTTLLTLALVENLQRADLNPIEEAEGYQRLMQEFALTQQQVADVVGKDRSTVANIMRLLALPASVRRLLQGGQLTLGHARALLALENERAIADLARDITSNDLSVREVERRVRAVTPHRARKVKKESAPADGSAETRRIADELRRRLQTDVRLNLDSATKGHIEIAFYSLDDLDRVIEIILGTVREPHA
jgi:ParB family transcriptional regulator, chromosome partitioning protein